MDCPNCRRPAPVGAAACEDCGLIFAKWRAAEERALAEKAAAEARERLLAADPVALAAAQEAATAAAPLTARQAVLIPAAAFLAAPLAVNTGFGRFFVSAGLSMQMHELGHALVSWLGGRVAIPIPMVTLVFSKDRSWLMAAAVTGGLAFLLWRAWKEECRAFAALCGAALLLQAKLTLFTTPDALDFWVSFGGLGGECYVAASLVVMYFARWPRFTRWPVYRTLFLAVGACVLAHSLLRWREASVDFEKVPFGSFFGGDGDVEAMISGGWTVNTLVAVYLRLSWACVAACALAWAWAARDFARLWRSPAELLD